MRIWSLHPCYLDTKGLVALWREALLAQKVLIGNTKGYKNHPQLDRFKTAVDPSGAAAEYLRGVLAEADMRGYSFNRSKIINKFMNHKIMVTNGQLEYEFCHLLEKLKIRDPGLYDKFRKVNRIKVHPIFEKVSGDVESWEKLSRKDIQK